MHMALPVHDLLIIDIVKQLHWQHESLYTYIYVEATKEYIQYMHAVADLGGR